MDHQGGLEFFFVVIDSVVLRFMSHSFLGAQWNMRISRFFSIAFANSYRNYQFIRNEIKDVICLWVEYLCISYLLYIVKIIYISASAYFWVVYAKYPTSWSVQVKLIPIFFTKLVYCWHLSLDPTWRSKNFVKYNWQ